MNKHFCHFDEICQKWGDGGSVTRRWIKKQPNCFPKVAQKVATAVRNDL